MTKDLIGQLQFAALMLAVIPTEELEVHVKKCRQSLSYADSFGVMIDPTGWMRSQADGSMDDARHQLTIAEHLLEARRAIDVREGFVQEKTKMKKPQTINVMIHANGEAVAAFEDELMKRSGLAPVEREISDSVYRAEENDGRDGAE